MPPSRSSSPSARHSAAGQRAWPVACTRACLLACLWLSPSPASAAVFDSSQAFYASRPGELFRPADRFDTPPFLAPDERDTLTYYWEGVAGGHPHRAVARGTQFSLDGARFDLAQATVFPGEPTEPPVLGADSRIYLGTEYACVEIAAQNDAAGTSRTHVYLLQMQPASARRAYRLPSLAASCLGIYRTAKNTLLF